MDVTVFLDHGGCSDNNENEKENWNSDYELTFKVNVIAET